MTNISDAMYENLQQILEKQNGRTYTFEEAKEIGDRPVDFFTLLIELDCRRAYSIFRKYHQLSIHHRKNVFQLRY